jgi:hypothetical protein
MKALQPAASPLVRQPAIDLRSHAQRPRFSRIASGVLLALLIVSRSVPAGAQDLPRVQVFGGYSFNRFDSPSFGFADSSNLNGYTFSPAFNIIQGFGVVAELAGQYNSKLNFRDLAIGGQFLYPRGKKTFFGRFLVGDGRSFVKVAEGEGDTSRAVIFGGGMDLDVTPRFAWRTFQVDYIHTTLFQEKQNNLRFSTGLVYRWGTIKQKGHKAPAQSP